MTENIISRITRERREKREKKLIEESLAKMCDYSDSEHLSFYPTLKSMPDIVESYISDYIGNKLKEEKMRTDLVEGITHSSETNDSPDLLDFLGVGGAFRYDGRMIDAFLYDNPSREDRIDHPLVVFDSPMPESSDFKGKSFSSKDIIIGWHTRPTDDYLLNRNDVMSIENLITSVGEAQYVHAIYCEPTKKIVFYGANPIDRENKDNEPCDEDIEALINAKPQYDGTQYFRWMTQSETQARDPSEIYIDLGIEPTNESIEIDKTEDPNPRNDYGPNYVESKTNTSSGGGMSGQKLSKWFLR